MRIIRLCVSAALLWSAASCSSKFEPPPPEVSDASVARVRRLTRAEYTNSVSAVTGLPLETNLGAGLAPEDQLQGFTTHDQLQVTSLLADQLDNIANNAAEAYKGQLALASKCPEGPNEVACATELLFGVAERAWRRPLTREERIDLTALWKSMRKGWDPDTSSRIVLQALFASPSFVYRTELGAPTSGGDQVVRLTQYEIASALSYAITAGPPDADLLAAAAAGQLSSADERERHARRLLGTPAALVHQYHFIEEWLGLTGLANITKNNQVYADFGEPFKGSSRRETELFIKHVLANEGGSIRELLGANYTFADGRMSEFYNTPTRTPDGRHGRVQLPDNRAGILTHASVMSTYALFDSSSPIRRGKFILTRLLCREQQPPPPSIVIIPPAVTTDSTTRARFAAHTNNPTCAGCHRTIDPLGFGMEDFDGVGKYRTQENNLPIDASGSLVHSEGTLDFRGAAELARWLASSPEVSDCVPLQVFRYVMGREEVDASYDHELIAEMRAAFRANPKLQLGDAFVALVRSPYFVHRRTSASE